MPVKLAIIPSVLATTQKVSKPSTSLACVDTVTFWPLKFYIFFHFYLWINPSEVRSIVSAHMVLQLYKSTYIKTRILKKKKKKHPMV